MKQHKYLRLLAALVLLAALLAGCVGSQAQVGEAQNAVPVPDKSNFYERRQIAAAEIINDRPGKVFWWYILADDGHLITQFTCIGRPVSSTESIEPNEIHPYSSSENSGFEVPLQGGVTAYSAEAMGLDGTYGEPVPFRFCITPEGHYVDVSMFALYITSDIPLTFENKVAAVNQELEAKKLVAEATLRAGGCIDSALNTIDCSTVDSAVLLEGMNK